MKHLDITVTGRVQGVFFRVSARQEALRLGLSGWARNQPGGNLLITVEGVEPALKRFVDWCREGPRGAEVTDVQVKPGELRNLTGFDID